MIVVARLAWLTGDSVGRILTGSAALIRQAAADAARKTVVSGDELSRVHQQITTDVLELGPVSTHTPTDCL